MPQYVRAKTKGYVFFFTVVLADRRSNLLLDQIDRLRGPIDKSNGTVRLKL
jgi:putative transposase